MFKKIIIFILLLSIHLPNAYNIVIAKCTNDFCKCLNENNDSNDDCDYELEKKLEDFKYFPSKINFVFHSFSIQKTFYSSKIEDYYISNYYIEIICPPPNVV